MTFSFTPRYRGKKKIPTLPTLKFPSISSKFREKLKKFILADFGMPQNKYLPNHIHFALLRSILKRFVRRLPHYSRKVVDNTVLYINSKRKQTALILLSVLFSFSVVIGTMEKLEQDGRVRESKFLSTLESQIEEANGLLRLNPIKARNLVTQIEANLGTAQESSFSPEKVLSLQTRFEEFKQTNFKVLEISDFKSVFESDDLSSGSIDLLNDLLLVANNSKNTMFTFAPGSSIRNDLSASEVESLITYKNLAFVYSKDAVSRLENTQIKQILTRDSEWGEIIDIDQYQGTSIYLLDRGGKIWRYQGDKETWGNKKVYYASNKSVDLATASSLSVDGNVWISFDDGGIVKLKQGKREEFGITGLDKPFGPNNESYTKEGMNNIYILDRSNNRFVIINKLGRFLNQYNSEVFSKVLSFSVDEKNKIGYFLINQKIISLELR